ncbi:MAG: cytochrome-c oxidase, cbb3-type subunit III [Alphaproteobacteria bacterium]|nr:cytochrome-c oxidase, cbb3-type subunit III [Alphaproteobacteria bacterium]
MGLIERDPHTGHGTTGHEWNGIKELNTAVPWPVWAFLIAAFAFSLVWWILMPAWPLGTTYSKGLLGADERQVVAAGLRASADRRADWTRRVEKESFTALLADKAVMTDVREAGHMLFGDNCAACHGVGAKGGPGFPDLTDKAWLWGGSPDAVLQTLRVGVNTEHADSRVSQMPAWGRDGMLKEQEIRDAVAYVYALSHPGVTKDALGGNAVAGKTVFSANCAACHGANAKGDIKMGAPDLTDRFWLYGGDEAAIQESVFNGRQGHMPSWEKRLSATERKILALYILDMGRSGQ